MPTTKTLTKERALLASTTYWKPGSPEHLKAARDFYHLWLTQQIEAARAKSPPFTSEQTESLVALLRQS